MEGEKAHFAEELRTSTLDRKSRQRQVLRYTEKRVGVVSLCSILIAAKHGGIPGGDGDKYAISIAQRGQ